MEILTIKLGDKTYQAGRFPAYLAREVLRIQSQQLEIAKVQDLLTASKKRLDEVVKAANGPATESDIAVVIAGISETTEAVIKLEADIYDRLLWVICETYGKQFSPDEVDHNLSRREIADQIRKITNATNGIFGKN